MRTLALQNHMFMKKAHSLFVLTTFMITLLHAQSGSGDKKIDQLMFLDVEEKYDKMAEKAVALTQNDNYKKNPLTYVYAAKGYYEMSKRPDKFDVGLKESKYPNPLKSAQKFMYKFVKKDKEGEFMADYKDLFEGIADTSNRVAQHLYIMEKQRKAGSMYKAAFKAVPNDATLQLWQGVCEVESKNTVEGERNILAAFKQLEGDFTPLKATSKVVASGILKAEAYFSNKGDITNANVASALVSKYKKYDPDELDKKKMEEREKEERAKAEKDQIMRKFYSDDDAGSTPIDDSSDEDKLDQIEKEMEQ